MRRSIGTFEVSVPGWIMIAALLLGVGCQESTPADDLSADRGLDAGLDQGRPDSIVDVRLDTSVDAGGSLCPAGSAAWTLGLVTCTPQAFTGYTLFAPLSSTTTYLIDVGGKRVHSWKSGYHPGQVAYLLENGNLLRTAKDPASAQNHLGGAGGRVQEIAWDGTVIWDYEHVSKDYCQHHDVERLPNGNVLMIAWERKTAVEALAAGRDPKLVTSQDLWVDYIVEVKPTGASGGVAVWEWHVWDHLIQDRAPAKKNHGVVASHPELIDVNFNTSKRRDLTHFNAVAYNASLDQIVVSSRTMSEVYVIDHSTTTAQAAGHAGGKQGRGGDILYRWGNPQTYGAGAAGDQKFFGQHDAQWIGVGYKGAGNLLVFNNGNSRPGTSQYSSAEEIVTPVTSGGGYSLTPGASFGPANQAWIFPTLYSSGISGVQRLPNGNTLICSGGNGTFIEIDSNKKVVWEYVNPVTKSGPLHQGAFASGNNVFRAYRYAPGYMGLKGRNLSPKGYIELPKR